MNINSSISLLSHIHSVTADFLIEKLSEQGLPQFASSHGNILFQLSINEKLTMGELAKKINRDKSTTTVLVRKLEKDGYLASQADSGDKRSRIIFLSEKGRKFNSITAEISQNLLKTFYTGFSEKEKEEFLGYLLRIEKNFSSAM